MSLHMSRPRECTTAILSHNVHYRLSVPMMYQGRFIRCNKYITLVRDVDCGGGCACVGAEGVWEISVPSLEFCCELETSLKKIKSQ